MKSTTKKKKTYYKHVQLLLDTHTIPCRKYLQQVLQNSKNCFFALSLQIFTLEKRCQCNNPIPFFPDSKQPSHGLGNVLSQIVLGKSIKPDFNAEEKLSIEKDSREISTIVLEMADYLPKEDPEKGKKKFCWPQSVFFPLIKVSPQFWIKGIFTLKPQKLRIQQQF